MSAFGGKADITRMHCNVTGKQPLLLVMPNWLGVTENAIQRAQKMAGDKYVAFVGCMYGEGKTCEGPPTSQEWMMAVQADPVEGRKRVNAALATMVVEADKRGIGTGSRKAAVGFCFGGGNVLELARGGADLDAVVCLHGHLRTTMPAKKGDIKAAVFVIHGTKDPVAPKGRPRHAGGRDGRRRRLRRAPTFVFRGRNNDKRHRRV